MASQPSVALGYKRPDEYDRDNSTLDIIAKILSGGHGGWLNRELMDEKRIVSSVQVQATFPGGRYPHLFVVVAVAAAGHTAEETEHGDHGGDRPLTK